MSTQLQLRRGTTAQIAAITPAQGEILYDTTLKGLTLGDGSTLGGIDIAYNYREGLFTPVLQFGGANVGITYGTQVGSYTTNGNRILFTMHIILTSKGSSTGTATISGLPFPVAASPAGNTAAFSIRGSALNASLSSPLDAHVSAGFSAMALNKFASGTQSNMADTDFTNTSDIAISGQYQI